MPFDRSSHNSYLKEREKEFDLDFGVRAKLPGYNALLDSNMKHYFENQDIQKHLMKTGQIDKIGRVINIECNKSKLSIIEKEFVKAEKIERDKQRDEAEARRQIRIRRLRVIENSQKLARVYHAKENSNIQREIVTATNEAKGLIKYKKQASSMLGDKRCKQQTT